MHEQRPNLEQEPSFPVACEYRFDGADYSAVTKFGADMFGDPHIQRTVRHGGELEQATAFAYCFSEPAILTGLVRHLAANMDSAARTQLHQQILARREAIKLRSSNDSRPKQVLNSFSHPDILSHEINKPAPGNGDLLCEVSLYGSNGDFNLQLVNLDKFVRFQNTEPIYQETPPDDTDIDEDYEPVVIGRDTETVFTLPDEEMIDFIACLSKSDRGRVHPDDMRGTLDGLVIVD